MRMHGRHCLETRNAEGERVLEFAIANSVRFSNTWFKNRELHLVTYISGGHSTHLGYILYRKNLKAREPANFRKFQSVFTVKAITAAAAIAVIAGATTDSVNHVESAW